MKYWLLLILSGVLLLSTLSSTSIAKDRRFFGNVKRMLFQPEDLYELIVKTEIDITKITGSTSSKFQIKYDGPYSFGILLKNISTDDYNKKESKPIDLRLKLEFYESNQLIFTTKSNVSAFSPFLGLRGNGIQLGTFETPTHIPLMKEIKCKATVLAPDETLQKQYGSVWFYIQKQSEK